MIPNKPPILIEIGMVNFVKEYDSKDKDYKLAIDDKIKNDEGLKLRLI